jgi:uncharacterized membrane protein
MKLLIKISIILFSILLIGSFAEAEDLPLFTPENQPSPQYYKGTAIEASDPDFDYGIGQKTQIVTVKVLEGKHRNLLVDIKHIPMGMAGIEMVIKAGDKLILYVDENPSPAESPDGAALFAIADYSRDTPAYWIIALFIIFILALAKFKGFKALVGLIITILLVMFVLLPLTLKGFSPVLLSILITIIVSIITFLLIAGISKKALSAIAGTILGVIFAAVISVFFGHFMHLSGLASEEAKMLIYSMNIKINFVGLLFSGIIIGALGAIMDVSMCISSSIDEVRKVHPEANWNNLFRSGVAVGQDIIGTMANTLILAYTGSSLPLLLLFFSNQISFSKVINLELVATEILRAMAGSIGLAACIPITAAIAAFLYNKK